MYFYNFFFLLISVFLSHMTANTFHWMNPNIQLLCFCAFEDNKILTWLDAIISLWFLSHTVPEFSLTLFTLWKGSCELSFSSPWTAVLLVHTVKSEQCPSFEPFQTSSLCLIFSLILRICYYFLIYQQHYDRQAGASALSLFASSEMATHSSILAWRIPGMGEPGGLPSMGSHRVWHDWSDLAAAAEWLTHTTQASHLHFGATLVFLSAKWEW